MDHRFVIHDASAILGRKEAFKKASVQQKSSKATFDLFPSFFLNLSIHHCDYNFLTANFESTVIKDSEGLSFEVVFGQPLKHVL